MKKKLVAAMLAGVMLLVAGCGSKEGKVNIGEYKGLAITNVSQATFDEEIASILEEYKELVVVDRAAVEGDTVNINYVGKKDGVPFENGTDDSEAGTDLVLGSNSFIDGFEDGLIGATAGEVRELNLTFPEEYSQNPDLAGQDVVFTVTVNEVKETVVPELTDEFVTEKFEPYTTVTEYKEVVRESLNKSSHFDQITEQLMATSEVEKYPEDRVEKEKQTQIDYYNYYAETYASYFGIDSLTAMQYFMGFDSVETMEEAAETSAYQMVKNMMILEKIASIEKIEVSDEEYATRALDYAESFGFVDVASFEEAYPADEIRNAILMDLVMEYIISQAVITDPQ